MRWPSAAPTGRYRRWPVAAAIGAVVHLLATAIEEGRDLSSMSGMPADIIYRLLPVWRTGLTSDAG
ncbi:hypothetical protein ACH4SK_32335 [Streptomyces inhibens]|uniref:hypothetical protein n=1 Tax=Streptomyces inhibens TaxID=2293571 RepID=UPI0037A553ED